MCTKFFSDGEVHKFFNPYGSPYEAFINYMNVLSDFTLRLNNLVPVNETEAELTKLKKVIDEQNKKLKEAELEIKKLVKPISAATKPKSATVKKVEEKPKKARKPTSK
jgi:alpha-amylase